MRKPSISLRALIAALAAGAPGAAYAACGNVVAGEHAFAGPGETCAAPAGTYNPTATGGAILPFNDPGYGFVTYGGGKLTTAGAVTIKTTADQADAVLSTGAGSLTTLTNGATLTTTGVGANGVEANSGGVVTLGSARVATTVTTSGYSDDSGVYSIALHATGANSQINATNVAVSSSVTTVTQVYADQGAKIGFTGGSIATTGRFAINAGSFNGSTLTLSGAVVSASGAGANTIVVGNGGTVLGDHLTITTTGAVDQSTGTPADAIVNNAFPTFTTTAGVVTITNSTVSTTGADAKGSYTDTSGVTTLTNDVITTSAVGAVGVVSGTNGHTNINGGSIGTAGANAIGIQATGAGASIVTNTFNNVGLAVSTTGANATGAQADTGGALSLTGGSVQTAGGGSVALYATGTGSQITATNVAASTSGNLYAQAVFAQSGGSITIKGGSADTSGEGSYAVAVLPGGSVQMTGTTIATTGLGSGGVAVNGTGGTFTGANLTITVKGGYDATDNLLAIGVANQSFQDNSGGGTVKLTNSTITIGGTDGIGAYNANGGTMTITGGSIATTGDTAAGVETHTGANTTLSNVQITTIGAASKGLAVFDATSVLNGSGLTISTTGGVDASGNHAQALYNGNGGGSGGGSTGGGTVALTGSTLTTSGDLAQGATTENGGSTSLTNTTVKTTGLQADAVFGSSGASIKLNNVTLTALGNASKGIDIEGTGTRLLGSGLTISTSGTTDPTTTFHAQGVYNGSSLTPVAGQTGGGVVTLTDSSVTTSGVASHGVQTADGGSTTFVGGSVSTSGASADAVLAQSGATTTINADVNGAATQITTSGASANGVTAASAAAIGITGAKVSTTGDGASGLVVANTGSSMVATNVTVSTLGGIDSVTGFHANAIYNGPGSTGTSGGTLTLNTVVASAAGFESNGLVTETGGVTNATGGSFTTTGQNASAVYVNAGTVTLVGSALATSGAGGTGIVLTGAGGVVNASNLTIATTGGVYTSGPTTDNADGVFNGPSGGNAGGGKLSLTDSSVKTSGFQSYGVSTAAASATTLLGDSIGTTGDQAVGLRVRDGGSTTVGLDKAGLATTISTAGLSAAGAIAFNGGALTLTGTTIATTGDGSSGLTVRGVGTTVTATNVTITTKGGFDATTGYYTEGVYNGPGSTGTSGGTLTLNNATVTVSGFQSSALDLDTGSQTGVTGGVFSSSGQFSGAVVVQGDAKLQINGATLAATGDSSGGLVLQGPVTVDGGHLTISASGGTAAQGPSAGIYNGPLGGSASGGTLSLSDTTVTISGAGAYGLNTGNGGTTTFLGGSVTTSGVQANGVYTSAGGATTLGLDAGGQGVAVATSGASSIGVVALGGGSFSMTGGSITTTGDGASGLAVNDAGTTVAMTNVTITTAGSVDTVTGFHAEGVYNGPSQTGTSGGTVTLTNVTANVQGFDAAGVETDAGGATTVTGGAYTVTGQESVAALVQGAGTLTISGATLTATADGSSGLINHGSGGTIVASNLTINVSGAPGASGDQSVGVYAGPFQTFNGGGKISIADSKITTSGAQGFGVFSNGGSAITVLGGSIATSGGGAIGALVNNAATLAIGLDASDRGATISTSGATAPGAVANGGGALTLTGTTIATTGDGSNGIGVYDAGSSVTATGVTIGTTGGIDTATTAHADGAYNGPSSNGTSGGTLTLTNASVTTAGFEAAGVNTSTGGVTTINGGTFTTSGENAVAVQVTNSGQLQISGATLAATGLGSPGLIINGSGGTLTASNLTITTTGNVSTLTGSHADGIYNGGFGNFTGGGTMSIADTTVKTTGAQADGVLSGAGGATTFIGGSILTTGAGSEAAHAIGGTLTIGLDAGGRGTSISTTGVGSYAVSAEDGGRVSLSGATVTTSQNGSGGLDVNGTGSEIDANGVSISTAGAYDSTSNLHAFGVYNGSNGSFATGGVANLTNVSVSTQGAGMYGVYTNAGGVTTIAGVSVTTAGAGANALEVTGAGSTATLSGAVALSTQDASAAAIEVSAGGAVTSSGALTINAGGDGLRIIGGASPSASVDVTGTLALRTLAASSAALTLSGDGASFQGSGGGEIEAAGTAVALLNGVGQSASFTNYTIDSVAGDLVYADPSTSTVTFNTTTANAGTGNLADVTNGSTLTLNAIASTLIGAAQTQAGSVSNFNLSQGSTWSITANSTVTNLDLNGSSASFASGGGFKTLTVNTYTGTNAALTFNALLGGANSGSDQLVINGGKATGTTTIFVNPTAFNGNLGKNVVLVTTTNGGSIAPGAFTLSGPLVVGGYLYSLQAENGGETLATSQGQSLAQASGSLSTLAQAKQSQAITGRVLSSILTGATEQINCTSCASGFASFGSFALGLHGRWTLSPSVAILAGGSYDSYSAKGVSVNNALLGALGVRYDMVALGANRPFLEAGLAVSPYSHITFRRSYTSALGAGTGEGDATSRSLAVYGRAGYIWRLSHTDEAAAYADLTRNWQTTGGYAEGATGGNPFGALVLPSLDTMNVLKVGAQFTHLFNAHVEGNISAGYALAFGANYGETASVGGFGAATGTAPSTFDWVELGGRLSYRLSKTVVADAFALGTLGAEPAGKQIHGGLALRMAF